MGKGHRHQKNLKSEKAKVKLKTKTTKTKHLPKGLNVTDTSFKVKKILIRDQLKTQNETDIVSRRNLNIKELITRLHHYNSSVRLEAVKGLKDILSHHSSKILSSQLHSLLQSIAALSLDKEKSVRRDSLKALNLILKPVSNDQLEPFFDILISYLSCAMTHIDPNIKEDSLLFLDVLAENCGVLLARSSQKVLPNFLDMISKLRTESRLERQLTTTLNSKQTSIRWRINVLSRLGNILTSMISVNKCQKRQNNDFTYKSEEINVTNLTHVPLFRQNYLRIHQLNLTRGQEMNIQVGNGSDLEEMKKFTKVLMLLMIESWIEVAPKKNGTAQSNLVITNEASSLLNTIMKIMELLIEYVDIFEVELGKNTIGVWFNNNFRNMFEKSILENFPYCETKTFTKLKKRQDDFTPVYINAKCLEQNLAICHVYVWLSSKNFTNGNTHSAKDPALRVLQYMIERLEDWSSGDNFALLQLIRSVKCLLLRASKVWYHNKINLGSILRAMVNVQSKHAKKELRSQLFEVLTRIILDHDATELHSEVAFKEFIASLPNFLLKHSIHEDTLKMLNRVVLQYRKWIENSLRDKHEEIIENAKKIEIIGSDDEKRSRLSICNLFYFIDGQVYY
ncbi:testis-expressed protein 10 homolog [Neodiprion pinetum]|uniref:testis-expressed protein 10 homolog n=1 Tax=Neodiprion pinetum TaxID=441929 RepID=UPI001EE09DBC|nr:testis-expressed protein 10 homolog [Neodiprion pinetum]